MRIPGCRDSFGNSTETLIFWDETLPNRGSQTSVKQPSISVERPLHEEETSPFFFSTTDVAPKRLIDEKLEEHFYQWLFLVPQKGGR